MLGIFRVSGVGSPGSFRSRGCEFWEHAERTFRELELDWDIEPKRKENQLRIDREKVGQQVVKLQIAGHDGSGAASAQINSLSLKAALPSARLCDLLQLFREINDDSIKAIKPIIREELAKRLNIGAITEDDPRYANAMSPRFRTFCSRLLGFVSQLFQLGLGSLAPTFCRSESGGPAWS